MAKQKNVVDINIKIEKEEWSKLLDEAFKKVIKKVKIDGFREGNAPRDVYEKKYGKESLYTDAIDLAIPGAYKKAVKESKLKPIIQPKIDIKSIDDNGIELTFTITSMPAINIKKYKGLDVKKEAVKITDKQVAEEIENIRNQYAELILKEGKIELGDTVIIDFEGFNDDKSFEGGKGENHSLEIGSNSFIPGFEEQLIGLKSGDSKDVKLSFPEDYHSEDLKGKPVIFKVKINEVKTKVIPNLDEEFFLDLGIDNIKTEEEFKKFMKKELKERQEYELENKYVDDLFDELLNQTDLELPEELTIEEIKRMMDQYEESLKLQGLSLEQFYKYTNSDEEALKAKMHEEAEKRVKLRFVLEEIIKLEKLEVTDEEANKEAEEMSKKRDMTKEEFIKAFGNLEMVKYDIKIKQVIDILKK